MKIQTAGSEGYSVIQNIFIDEYMPHANGEFVKVYLYLLRCANTGRDLSVSSIADVFEHTEKDVQRALLYWEKQNLIRIQTGKDGSFLSVTMLEPAEPQTLSEPATPPVTSAPEKVSVSEPERKKTMEQQEIRQLCFIAEQYLQRPITSSEQNDFIYYYETLQFSVDLIEYLLEYCISKGSGSRHYMRKVALTWAEEGITTVLQAKQQTTLYHKNYFTILDAFGIKGRHPAPAEQEMMSRWLHDFGFSMDLILEACNRTIRQTHQPNFSYADKILEQWHTQKAVTMADVKELDFRHSASAKKESAPSQKPVNNRFQNFEQRDYNFQSLEKQLVQS